MTGRGSFDYGFLVGSGRHPTQTWQDLHDRGTVLPGPGMWLVVGYDAASAVLRDHVNFSSEISMGMMGGGFGKTMLFVDPPDHTRLRGVVSKPFTPRNLAALEPRIREITRTLLDKMVPGEPFEIMSGLARPLPVIVIAEMLGLDTDALDTDHWSDARSNMAQMMSMSAGGAGRGGVFEATIASRRRSRRDDLISLLVQAVEDGVMDDSELVGACALLFIAGNVTTTSLLGNAVLALSRHPDQCAALAEDPSLIPNALEEVFRYDPPVPAIPPRSAVVQTVIDGHTAPVGTNVIVMAAAANRDPKRFPEPDAFDVTRADAANHLAFGAGIHYCLGAPLSRLESRVAMEEVLDRVPSLRLSVPYDEISYDGSSFLRAPSRAPIAV